MRSALNGFDGAGMTHITQQKMLKCLRVLVSSGMVVAGGAFTHSRAHLFGNPCTENDSGSGQQT